MPGDFVIREGDIGNSVVFIKRGQVERLSCDSNDARVLDLYGTGTVIGEVNLVCCVPRIVTLRAKTYVDLLTLSKENLDSVLEYFPLMSEQLHVNAEERYGHVIAAVQKLERDSRESSVFLDRVSSD